MRQRRMNETEYFGGVESPGDDGIELEGAGLRVGENWDASDANNTWIIFYAFPLSQFFF